MLNLLFSHQFHMDSYVKSHQQLVAEYRDRTSRISARLSSPGYSRVIIQEPDGSSAVCRVYTANYLQYAHSDRAWVLYKILYSLLLIVGAAASVSVMPLPSTLNCVPYIGALEVLSLIPLVYLLYTMFHQVFAPRRMEIRHHKLASVRMKIGAFVYGLWLIVLLAVMLAYGITSDGSFSSTDMLCAAAFLTDAILIVLLFVLETKRRCISVPNILPDNMEILE